MHRAPSFIAGTALLSLLRLPHSSNTRCELPVCNRTFYVANVPTVRIKADDANVVVRSWKESRVSVRVEQFGRTAGLIIGHHAPEVEIAKDGNEVRVAARLKDAAFGIMFSNARLGVEVWLPENSNLIAEAGDGTLKVENVSGHIELMSGDGAVIGHGLRGDVQVFASDGHVELEDLDGSLRLENRDGHSELRGRFGRMNLASSDGRMDVDAVAGSRLTEDWTLRSQDGGIRLRIPRALAATLDARTKDGGLSVDLPVRIQGSVREHEIVGDLNGGGPVLRLRCSDGPIRVSAID